MDKYTKWSQEIEKKLNLNIIFEFDDTDLDLDCRIEKKGNLKPVEKLKSSNENIEVEENLALDEVSSSCLICHKWVNINIPLVQTEAVC